MSSLGARVYGLAAIVIGVTGIVWGGLAAGGISIPKAWPDRVALADAASALFIVGGVLINWRRFAVWGAALLTALFALDLFVLCLPRLATHLAVFGYWDATAEPVALGAAGLIACVMNGTLAPQLSSRLQYVGRAVFGLCLFAFGWAHFAYLDHTVSMVPAWIPPSQMFWAWFTALAAIAAGLAFISGVWALPAARLLTLMYVIFGIFVHVPILMAGHTTAFNWAENAVNLALAGAAWVIADSLAARTAAS
ncbi:MAG TPA: DoxX family membrane protein [Rhizomicrobium sp.]|nr:DoxX family membrane protein [Rhizomicrobium sp.]